MEDKKLTFDEIITIAKEMYGDDGVSDFAEGMWYSVPEDFEPLSEDATAEERKSRRENYANTQPLGHTTEVDSTGGMDEGSDWSTVQHFTKHDVYIQTSGWYQSHSGVEFYDGWESCSEVTPKQKTITVYT